MRNVVIAAALFGAAVALVGCEQPPSSPTDQEPLAPAEVFTWAGGQPVSFALPPDGWNRSRYQNGGTEGVDFVKAGSVGEQILVAERLFLGNRDHCVKIQEIRRDVDNQDQRTFELAIQRAKLYASEPKIGDEERRIRPANDALDRARAARQASDDATLHVELKRALEHAANIRYTLDQTVDRVRFTGGSNSVYTRLEVEPPRRTEVAGLPAESVAFTFDAHRRQLIGRRVYVVANNRMFEFGYQGLPENLPLFERVLESVTFPPGPCAH